ncbi:hypothetical protein KIF59_11545 [Enterobacter cloacae subsp. cloacae]|nr:hypothetical protein [Enterobacter cloacae subsp. cloacae]
MLLGASAFAAPAGDLPDAPGLRRLNARPLRARWCNNQLSVSVSGDDLGDAVNRLRQRIALQKPAGRCSRRPTNPKNRPSALPSPKK